MGYQSVSKYIVPAVVVYSEFTVNWSDYFLSKQVGLNQKVLMPVHDNLQDIKQ